MNWWNKTDTACTPAELKNAINHVLLTDTINLRTDGKRAISGVVSYLLHVASKINPLTERCLIRVKEYRDRFIACLLIFILHTVSGSITV